VELIILKGFVSNAQEISIFFMEDVFAMTATEKMLWVIALDAINWSILS
jgi:hypothetical protein